MDMIPTVSIRMLLVVDLEPVLIMGSALVTVAVAARLALLAPLVTDGPALVRRDNALDLTPQVGPDPVDDGWGR